MGLVLVWESGRKLKSDKRFMVNGRSKKSLSLLELPIEALTSAGSELNGFPQRYGSHIRGPISTGATHINSFLGQVIASVSWMILLVVVDTQGAEDENREAEFRNYVMIT